MSQSTILDTDYVTVWHHPEDGIVHHKFHRYIYGKEFRDALEAGLKVFEEKGATKWLSDDRENSALPADDGEWGMNDWFPRVLAAGWKYWAIVLPKKTIGQMNMQQFIDTYTPLGLTVQVFSELEPAMDWLKSKE